MKKWNVDRVTIFFFIVVVSFLYDLAFYLGIRDTARFPHPFVYFRSLGDIEYLRGFPGMLRQAMFSLVAGGLLGWAIGFVILKSGWLSRATILFLRIAMWFPFLLLFAVPATFMLGIAAAMLAGIYHYLTARLFLEFSSREAFGRAAGEVTLQILLFTLIAQIWVRRWDWPILPMTLGTTMGLTVLGLILCLAFLLNWIFRRSFQTGCDLHAIVRKKELLLSKRGSVLGVTLLTVVWLLIWQLTRVAFGFDAGPFETIQRISEFFTTGNGWRDIQISLVEITSGVVFGGLLSFVVSIFLQNSKSIRGTINRILPATYLSSIALWLLAFLLVESNRSGLFIGIGGKAVAVGFLTFFPLIQDLWAFRDSTLLQRWAIAVDDALPIAFVAMLFGELYAATAGLGFQMTVASATYQYQQGLAYFLITAIFLAVLSMILSLIVRLASLQTS